MPQPPRNILGTAALVALTAISFMATLTHTSEAEAFCGFYVSGADQEMYNNATMVVMFPWIDQNADLMLEVCSVFCVRDFVEGQANVSTIFTGNAVGYHDLSRG